MNHLRQAAQHALEALEGCVKALDALHAPGDSIYTRASDLADRAEIALRAALAQQEEATVKESLPVGQEEPEGGWQSAPSPQVTQRIADMPMSEYRRGVNDGFKLGLREGRIKAEDEMREQPEREPVAWRYQNANTDHVYLVWNKGTGGRNWTPLYAHPPRREWQSLSEEEIHDCFQQRHKDKATERRMIALAIEAALKEKNQ